MNTGYRMNLNIPMNDSHTMKVTEAIGKRVYDTKGLFFGEDGSTTDAIKEFSSS